MPDWNTAIRERLRGLNLEPAREAEIVEEVSQHLEDRYRELVAAGTPDDQALRAALDEVEPLAEGIRKTRQPSAREPAAIGAERGGNIIAGLWYDLRMAARVMRVKPGFSATVVFMLALGVAGNVAIFSVFNGLFLRPLPFAGGERLVYLDEAAPKWGLTRVGVSNLDFHGWRNGSAAFEKMAAFSGGGANLSDSSGMAQNISTARVTYELLDTLSLRPALGRNFRPEEDRPGAPKVVLLGYDLWKRVFHGDPNVPGKVVKLDGQPVTVVGVLPPEAAFPPRAEAWTPLAADPNDGNAYYLGVVGRLRQGVSPVKAKADLLRIHKGMIQSVKALSNEFTFPTVEPLRDRYLGDFKTAVHTLLGAVGVVLLMACVNIAGLMMVRGEARSREIAIRTAVGASGRRIVRQLLTESLFLAGLGGVVGVALGQACLRALIILMPEDLPRWVRFDWDWRFALFAIAITGAAALLFGLAPALQAASADSRGCLQAASRSTLSRGKRGTLGALVVCEIALALMLLICSGLLIQAFRKVLHVDPGFRPDNVLSWSLDLPESRYPKAETQFAFYRDLAARLSALPGVTAASAVSKVPLGGHDGFFVAVEGAPPSGPKDQNPVVLELVALPGYLKAMGIALTAGRALTEQDEAPGAANVALVNETFAKRFWPGADPLGKRFRDIGRKFTEKDWFRVVGVTRDVRHYGQDEEVRPAVFKPFPARPRSSMALVLRTSMDAGAVTPSAREAMRRMDSELAMADVKTMTQRLDASLAPRRAAAWLFGAFAVVAIMLAVAGIYSVVSFAVSQRNREIGIRMALGARPRQVLLGILGQGMTLVAIGIAAGVAASVGVAGLLKSMLFGVSGHDAATYGTVIALVACVGALANWLPARRAAGVDPNSVLRFE